MTNPTLLVSTFDNSLALTDVNGEGTWTGVAPVRYAAVGAEDGIWLEEAATNFAIDPQNNALASYNFAGNESSVALSAADLPAGIPGNAITWTRTGSGTTYVEMKGVFAGGSHVAVLDNPGVNHILSLYIKGTAGCTAFVDALICQADGTYLGDPNGSVVELTGAWQRILWSGVPTATNAAAEAVAARASITTTNQQAGDAFKVAGWMVHEGSAFIDYFDGESGAGYDWDGSDHASASTRDASSVSVDQDGTARIDPASGAIAFRYKRKIDTGAEETILTCGTDGAGTDYLKLGVTSGDKFFAEWKSNGAAAQRVTSTAANLAVDTEYFLYADWDGTTIRVSVDNGALDSDTRDAAQGSWGAGELVLTAA